MDAEAPIALREPSAPPYRPNPFFRWLTSRFFQHIQVDERWASGVAKAATRGTVVYILRSRSAIDFLCLDYLTKRRSLPLIRFVNDLGLWAFEPFGRGLARLWGRRRETEQGALQRVLALHGSALLFLWRGGRRGRPRLTKTELEHDLVRALVQAQRQQEQPILLVPQTILWGKLAKNRAPNLWDFLLGSVEWPGRVRSFFRFLLHYRGAVLRSGEPFDLCAFLHANPELSDEAAANQVRYAMLRRVERERTLVLGPAKKSPLRLREEIVRSPRLAKHIEATMRSSGQARATVEREVERELIRLCATPDPTTLAMFHRVLDRVWHTIYDGIEVDQEGIARVREAARSGPLILLPSHKSHVDYLVLSYVFYTHQLSPPLIAAGDNLSFFPLGNVLRRGGAFFIRRSFKGKKLYSALVDTYVRKLLLDGHHIELFIEGGRSRTGKLLPPQFGILSMIVDACLLLHRQVHFVPISVGYELIVEQQSYVTELVGGEKQRENIGDLLKTPEVLRSRYGRLYIQFGELLSLDRLISETRGSVSRDPKGAASALSPAQRRGVIQRIGHRAVYEINRVTMVTPVSLVSTCFLVHRRRSLSRDDLEQTATELRDALERLGARLAPTLQGPGPIPRATLTEATALLRDSRLINEQAPGAKSYVVPEERRLALEYYKNNILHFFVPSALIAAALGTAAGQPMAETALREQVLELSRTFKHEFSYRADTDFDRIFDDALAQMLAASELERDGPRVRLGEGPRGRLAPLYASLIRTYFEAYLLAVRGLLELPAEGRERKDFIKRTLALGQRLYLAGEISDRESISKPKLENSVSALKDAGLLKISGSDLLERAPDPDEAAHAFIQKLKRYLV